jgi:hypothetical protein
MPTVQHRVCRSVRDVQEAVRLFDGPLAVKACASAVPHKSEHGLVALNVRGGADAAAAFVRLKQTLESLGVDGHVTVAPMVTRGREVMLGAKVDPLFGPVIMVGDGGKFVEVFNDLQLLMPPFTLEEARQAVLRLRIAPLFNGVRGDAPLDLDALCAAIVRLGEVVSACGDEVASIDLNPVVVGAVGEGVVIVDALVERNLRSVVTR